MLTSPLGTQERHFYEGTARFKVEILNSTTPGD